MIEFIPSILVKTKEELLEKIMVAEKFCTQMHLDIADGIFVPNMTIGGFREMSEVETVLKTGVHLMVSKPENHIVPWLEVSIDRVIFHIEATKKSQEIIAAMKETEKAIGVALNPGTPLAAIQPVIDSIDFIHFMTVEPGFYGGKFVEAVLEKIMDCHYFYPDKPICVDGGVNPETAPWLVKAGASTLIAGSYLWQSGDFQKALSALRDSVSGL